MDWTAETFAECDQPVTPAMVDDWREKNAPFYVRYVFDVSTTDGPADIARKTLRALKACDELLKAHDAKGEWWREPMAEAMPGQIVVSAARRLR